MTQKTLSFWRAGFQAAVILLTAMMIAPGHGKEGPGRQVCASLNKLTWVADR